MAGLGVRVFTDEMINPRVATELVRLGYDVESCRLAGRRNQRIIDHAQLTYATQYGAAGYLGAAVHQRWGAGRYALTAKLKLS